MDRSQTPVSDPDRPADGYDGRTDAAVPTARFVDESDPARRDVGREAERDDEPDPADRAAFRIGANLLTLLVLVLAAWWLWRHVLAPALLGPG